MRFDTLFKTLFGSILIAYGVGMLFAVSDDEWIFYIVIAIGCAILAYNKFKLKAFRDYYWLVHEGGSLFGPFKNDKEVNDFLSYHDIRGTIVKYWIPAKDVEKAKRILGLH
jgi:hypothetical protein